MDDKRENKGRDRGPEKCPRCGADDYEHDEWFASMRGADSVKCKRCGTNYFIRHKKS